MQIPLKITVRDVPKSEAVEAHIREKVDKLEEFYTNITSCRVVVEVPHKHRRQGMQYGVRIDLTVPGSEIVVNREHDLDVYVALRDAFDAAKRQLEDHVRRVRRDVKTHVEETVGRVVRIFPEDGIGFVTGPDGTEHYFNRENVISPRFELLKEGDEVKFIEEVAGEGVQAKRVSAGHHHVP